MSPKTLKKLYFGSGPPPPPNINGLHFFQTLNIGRSPLPCTVRQSENKMRNVIFPSLVIHFIVHFLHLQQMSILFNNIICGKKFCSGTGGSYRVSHFLFFNISSSDGTARTIPTNLKLYNKKCNLTLIMSPACHSDYISPIC